jgi:AraC-like DNA-binding protein
MDPTIRLVRHDVGDKPPATFIDNEYVLHVVHHGSFTFQLEASSFSIHAGDIVLIPPLTLHALRDQQDVQMTVVHFAFRCATGMPYEVGPVVSPDADVFATVERYTKRLRREAPRTGVAAQVLASGLLQCVLGLILEVDTQFRKRSTSEREFPRWRHIEQAVTFIREHYANPDLAIADVCRHVGLSYNYFCTAFHEYTNDTPRSFVTRVRLNAAKDSLFTSERNVGETALACGFRGAAQFSKIFKRYEGVPPKQWITQLKTAPGVL